MQSESQWLFSNTSDIYPFDKKVIGTSSLDSSQFPLHTLFADASIIYRGNSNTVRLDSLFLGPSASLTTDGVAVNIKDYLGVPIFNQADTKTVRTWGDWLITEITYNDNYACLVCYIPNFPIIASGLVEYAVTDTDQGYFVPRVLNAMPERISSISFNKEGSLTTTTFNNIEELTLREGYNINLTPVVESVPIFNLPGITTKEPERKTTEIQVDATAGGGIGRYPAVCAAGTLDVFSINGVTPSPQGDLFLEGDGCLGFTASDINELTWQNVCQVCCDCENFEGVYELMRRLYAEGANLKTTLDGLYQKLSQTISSWNQGLANAGHVIGAVRIFPKYRWTAGVQVVIFNGTPVALKGYNFALNFNSEDMSPGSVTLISRSGLRTTGILKNEQIDPVQTTSTHLTLYWPSLVLGPGNMVVWNFEILVPDQTGRADAAILTAILTGSLGGVPIASTASTVNIIGNIHI